MVTALFLLGLVASCFGQLKYPDDDFFKTTTDVPTFYYPTQIRQAFVNRKISNRQTQTTPARSIVFRAGQEQYRFQTNPRLPGKAFQEFGPAQGGSTGPVVFDLAQGASSGPIVFDEVPRVPGNPLQDFNAARTTTARPLLFAAARTAPAGPKLLAPVSRQRPVQMDSHVPEDALQNWGEHVNNIIVHGVWKFSLDVERQIYRTRSVSMIEQRDNVIFSPISLTVALAIILAGSAGKTFEEATKVLGLEAGVDISRNSEIVHQMFGIMLNQLDKKLIGSLGPRVDFATATYVQEGFPVLTRFKALSNEVYQTEVINVDFAGNGKATEAMINAWVKEKTMGKITSILNEPPSPDTMMILLSALYFNGEWNQYFFDGATKRRPFFIEPNESIEVDMMYNGGIFPFYEDKQLGVKILGLPYKGHEMSMYILLPTAEGAKALREFTNKLTVDIIENLVKNTKNQTCIIGLPRMKLSSSLSLKTTLESLGLRSLFDPATADLSLLSQINNRNIENTTASTSTPHTTMTTPYIRPGKTNMESQTRDANKDVLIFNRMDSNDGKVNHMVKRNFFAYEDKLRGYTVKQWATGFSLKKNRKTRDVKSKEDRNSYIVGEKPEGSDDNAKVVNLEENKYRFQKKENAGRRRRQSRPIDQNFLEFVKERNFPSYGLDDLRNSANLINPHIVATDVLQKVEIDITEKGTEAAAVTSVTIERDGSQKRLLANRPFIFFIRHESTRLVLFWGTINVPTPNYPAT